MWRPRLFRALRGLDGFGGVRSRGTPRMTLARFARDFGEHERRFPGCLGGALARSTTLRSCPRLALRFALSGGRCLGSAACLASLHPRPPRGSRSPAMTLMRFVSHRFGADRPSPHPGTDRTVVPSELERDLAQIDLAGPLGPAAHATAFQSFPPRPDWVSVSRSLPSCGSHWTASIRRPRARFRASFPGIRRASRSWRFLAGCFPRLSLQGVHLLRPGSRFDPGPSSCAIPAPCPSAVEARRPGVLRTVKLAGRFRLPTFMGFATTWVAEVAHTQLPNSQRTRSKNPRSGTRVF